MKVLITGGDGLIARNIGPELEKSYHVIYFSKKEWNILDKEKGRKIILEFKPNFLINLAAYTDVDRCEDEKEIAMHVNAQGPGILAELCDEVGVDFVHFSTDYVFDGEKGSPYNEEDLPNPLSYYGLTKLEGEREVMKRHKKPLIVRTQWIYGKGGKHFIKKLIELSEREEEVGVVIDQMGCPTYAKDIATPLKALIEGRFCGVFHIANSGFCTWYEFAREVFSILNIQKRLKPICSNDLKRKAKRPLYSVLDTGKLKNTVGLVMRDWKEALHEYLGELS